MLKTGEEHGRFWKEIKDEELMENINVGQRLSKTGFFTHDLVRQADYDQPGFITFFAWNHDNIYNVIHDEGQKAFLNMKNEL